MTASDTEPPAHPTEIDGRLLRTAFVLVLGTFMATLDATIVNVGIDTLATEFRASVTEIQWVTTAYLLAVTLAVPSSGWIVDRFGGRRTWIGAVVLFLVGSLLCAMAWSTASLIVFRVIQGLGGGLLPPVGQALVAREAGPKRIGRIISIVGVIPLLSPVFGPVIGGSILAVADWTWLFWVNIPIGLVAALLALRFVAPNPPAAQGTKFDVLGAALLPPGLAVLVLGLTELGNGRPVTSAPVLVGLVGVVMLGLYAVHALRTRGVPLIDLRLFTRPPFAAAAAALIVLGASVYGAMFLLPLYFQLGRGLTPFAAGLLLAPQGLGAALGSIVVNRTVDRVAPRTLVLTGIGLIAAGTVLFTQLGSVPPEPLIVASMLVRGLGLGMIGAPVMSLVYSSMPHAQLPRASSALNLLNTLGGSVGTAVLAVILQTRLAARAPLGEPGIAFAFADTFWWTLGFCLVAVVGATRLPRRAPAEQPASSS
ncbi:EmrB/QacA subfamily drug resistance transporter [Actinomycetospora succinea]|uniref:EmrB/QacA subfamily drug resistance transporter n=1 Tax=Actinomycetospora succinea TaxID=663603 RepID=A0A4R6VPT8_9PSEU|nr:MDR family MFS transporter [Actinomycetospora succinea]TDQ65341.1 EmrB/QacA subfamily drug resistance transporter [Actinomycetospora succinea]